MREIGQSRRPIDWQTRTDGSLKYSGDLRPESPLEAAILRSPHPHARIVRIDTAAARQSPGVHAVVTAADFPAGIRYLHEGAADRPPLADDFVRFIGQEVAAVAAENLAQAEHALGKIVVHYERLKAPLNIGAALSRGAARLHERKSSLVNIAHRFSRMWGDYEGGVSASTITADGTFLFPRQNHACMEPTFTVAEWNDAEQRLHLWTATQAPYYLVLEVRHVLGLNEGQVVCHEIGVGGGFGARSKVCENEAIAGALARATGRPVRIKFTRGEEFETTKSRHAFSTAAKLHADSSGRLLAIEASINAENGAYNHCGVSVLSAAIKALGMLYRPLGVSLAGRLIDTATLPGGAFRGYGSTQTSFALESLMDEVATKVGVDPLELRRRNANRPGDTTLAGARLGSARLLECLDAAGEAIGWTAEKANRRPGRGVGISSGVHVSGAFTVRDSNRSDAAIDIFPDGRVRLRFGGADAGTGQKTILAQIAAEELGVDLAAVDVLTMDSQLTPFDMGAWSSRGTHFGGHAVRKCAIETARRLKSLAANRLGEEPLRLKGGFVVGERGSLPIGEVAGLSNDDVVDGILVTETSFVDENVEPADPVTGQGNISASYNFAAHAAIVEVDVRTGQIEIVDYVAAHDIGTAINPVMTEGQVLGGTAMGIGAALREEMIYEQGKLANPSYINYGLPRAGDLPRIRPILVGGGDPRGPYGAKAVGECGINPPAAAIANAVFDAIGIRIHELPITPDKILSALAKRDGQHRTHAIWRRPSRWWIALVRWAYPRGLLSALHARAPLPVKPTDRSPIESVARPGTVAEACAALGNGAAILAGGTDLQPRRRQRLIEPKALVSLGSVEALREVSFPSSGTIEIGSMTSLASLAKIMRSQLPILTDAIDTIASAQIREMATVAGNLLQAKRCWFYRSGFSCYKRVGGLAPCYAINGDHRFYHAAIDGHRCQATTPSDLATVFAALDAEVVIAGPNKERQVRVLDLYSGPGESVLTAAEVLRAIRIPPVALRRRCAFAKLRLWEGDFAIVSAAIAVDIDDRGVWSRPCIVVGGLAPVPWRAEVTARVLEGQKVTSQLLKQTIDRELADRGHPLARNAWKLDAAAGVAQQAFEKLTRH